MPFGKRGTKTPAQRVKYDTTMRRMRAARAARIRNSRAIAVSTGQGRNAVRRKVMPKMKKMSKFQRGVQSVIMQTVEKKYREATINFAAGTDISASAAPWYHNALYPVNLWALPQGTNTAGTRIFPTQGLTDGNRIGDEIYATGISVRLMFNVPSDRRTANLKCWFLPWNSVQGDPANKSNFFHGLINNTYLDKIQTDRWPGLKYLGMFRNNDPDNTYANAHGQIIVNLWIPLKRKITFITDGDTIVARGLKEHGTLLFAPYDKVGSLETDQLITAYQGTVTFHYKDP